MCIILSLKFSTVQKANLHHIIYLLFKMMWISKKMLKINSDVGLDLQSVVYIIFDFKIQIVRPIPYFIKYFLVLIFKLRQFNTVMILIIFYITNGFNIKKCSRNKTSYLYAAGYYRMCFGHW